MFRTAVQSTPMTTEAANLCFENITGSSYNGDYSFLATLRALVAPRIGDGRINLSFNRSTYGTRDIANYEAKRIVRAVIDIDYYIEGAIVVHSFEGRTQEDNYACLELMKSTFCQVYSGFERMEKVTDFFRKTFYSMCFVNPAKKQVVIFVDSLNTRKMHYLQCAIFAFLPWYFDPEVGVSQDEMELIQSLREKTSDAYERCIAKIASKYNFREVHIKHLLKGFETRFDRAELEKTRREIESLNRNMEELIDKYANKLRQKNEADIKYLGIQQKIENSSEDSEIMEYFLCNKKLFIEGVDDSSLIFSCKDYLTYYDEDMAKRFIDNKRSYIYRPNSYDVSDIMSIEDAEKLATAIFIDQTLKIKMCAAYYFELGGRVRGVTSHTYPQECNDSIPNAHIDRYNCLGNYERTINECVRNHDYIGALEQCIASCKSLNFADSIVMNNFMERLYGRGGYTHNKCIELPDGRCVNAVEAVKWMKNSGDAGESSESEEVIVEVEE